MNTLNTKHQNTSSSLLAPPSDSGPAHRLIVLVPNDDLDYTVATRRIWELANHMGAHIQFIGLCKNELQESSLRRRLIIMTAMVQDGEASAEAKVELGNNWVNVVQSNWQRGDVIVCFAEQRAGLLYRPLSQILRSKLDIPVYILSDLYPQSQSTLYVLSFVRLWAGLISIIVCSFLLQIRIISLSRDWAQTTLLILSVMAELWLIWIWNHLFG